MSTEISEDGEMKMNPVAMTIINLQKLVEPRIEPAISGSRVLYTTDRPPGTRLLRKKALKNTVLHGRSHGCGIRRTNTFGWYGMPHQLNWLMRYDVAPMIVNLH